MVKLKLAIAKKTDHSGYQKYCRASGLYSRASPGFLLGVNFIIAWNAADLFCLVVILLTLWNTHASIKCRTLLRPIKCASSPPRGCTLALSDALTTYPTNSAPKNFISRPGCTCIHCTPRRITVLTSIIRRAILSKVLSLDYKLEVYNNDWSYFSQNATEKIDFSL